VNQPAFVMAILGFSATTASMLGPAVDDVMLMDVPVPAGQNDHKAASVSSKGIFSNVQYVCSAGLVLVLVL
jgi:hypothetical protein